MFHDRARGAGGRPAETGQQCVKETFEMRRQVNYYTGGAGWSRPGRRRGEILQWLPRSTSESVFPSMIDLFRAWYAPQMCVCCACNLCGDRVNKHVHRFSFFWVSYHDEHGRAPAWLASLEAMLATIQNDGQWRGSLGRRRRLGWRETYVRESHGKGNNGH